MGCPTPTDNLHNPTLLPKIQETLKKCGDVVAMKSSMRLYLLGKNREATTIWLSEQDSNSDNIYRHASMEGGYLKALHP